MWMVWLAACNDPNTPFHLNSDPFTPVGVLVEATARCDPSAAVVVIRARTEGWAKSADFDIWVGEDPALVVQTDRDGLEILERDLPTVGFTEAPEELCDVMEATVVLPPDTRCDALTYAIRVTSQEGCAGCAVIGYAPRSLYNALDDPPDADTKCHVNRFDCFRGDEVFDPADDAATCTEVLAGGA